MVLLLQKWYESRIEEGAIVRTHRPSNPRPQIINDQQRETRTRRLLPSSNLQLPFLDLSSRSTVHGRRTLITPLAQSRASLSPHLD
jgi:hypothetical protein